MKRLHSLLLLLTALFLTSCANTSTLKITSVQGGEMVSIPKHYLNVTLPNGWMIAETPPANSLLLAAADNEKLRFVIVGPLGAKDPGSKDALVANATYQQGVRRTLAEGGFTKVERAGMVNVAGMSAFRCDASARGKTQSITQVHVPHNNRVWVLSFYSTRLPISKVPAVTSILSSIQFVR